MNSISPKFITRPKRLIKILVAAIIVLSSIGYIVVKTQEPGGASLYGHNHTDRPIFSYWVNDNWGGNGGVTCCWRLNGSNLRIVWILDVTPEQIAQGLSEERHEIDIQNPPRMRADRYLHVHFFPDNEVQVAWSPDHFTPHENHGETPSLEVSDGI